MVVSSFDSVFCFPFFLQTGHCPSPCLSLVFLPSLSFLFVPVLLSFSFNLHILPRRRRAPPRRLLLLLPCHARGGAAPAFQLPQARQQVSPQVLISESVTERRREREDNNTKTSSEEFRDTHRNRERVQEDRESIQRRSLLFHGLYLFHRALNDRLSLSFSPASSASLSAAVYLQIYSPIY